MQRTHVRGEFCWRSLFLFLEVVERAFYTSQVVAGQSPRGSSNFGMKCRFHPIFFCPFLSVFIGISGIFALKFQHPQYRTGAAHPDTDTRLLDFGQVRCQNQSKQCIKVKSRWGRQKTFLPLTPSLSNRHLVKDPSELLIHLLFAEPSLNAYFLCQLYHRDLHVGYVLRFLSAPLPTSDALIVTAICWLRVYIIACYGLPPAQNLGGGDKITSRIYPVVVWPRFLSVGLCIVWLYVLFLDRARWPIVAARGLSPRFILYWLSLIFDPYFQTLRLSITAARWSPSPKCGEGCPVANLIC